ncbi:hypothetical protein ACQ4PT_002102 [Festuca glaucescens]
MTQCGPLAKPAVIGKMCDRFLQNSAKRREVVKDAGAASSAFDLVAAGEDALPPQVTQQVDGQEYRAVHSISTPNHDCPLSPRTEQTLGLAPIQPWRGGGVEAAILHCGSREVKMLHWLKGDRKPQQGMSTSVLPDELVVDILSRLPLKSICRFKCVCKSWLAFSCHPYYRQKLPRTPAGLLYRKREPVRLPWSLGTSIHLASLPANYSEIDTRLNFVPLRYKYSNLEDCSNGLLLCYQGGGNKREEISNAIVCNPATQEWMALPNTEPGPPVCSTDLRLCFDPLWSQNFYVFKVQSIPHLTPHIGSWDNHRS